MKDDGKGGVDPAILAKVLATTCVLSHKPLAVPVVSDSLGRLYNKDAVVTYLLQRGEKAKSREASVAGHLRGLKDVRELKLTPNTVFKSGAASSEEDLPAPFICPLTNREMNGKHRFVYLTTCGCVMSESGLRAVVNEQLKAEKTSAGCPICGTAFAISSLAKKSIIPGGDIILLNGTDAEVEDMLRCTMERRDVEAARKKELKAKDILEGSEEKRQKKEEKRKRKEDVMKMLDLEEKKARMDSGLQAIPTKAGMVAAEAKNHAIAGKEMSAAMRSIYGLDRKASTGSDWMTRGTFNRFA